MPNDEQIFSFGENVEMVFVDAQTKRLDSFIRQTRDFIWTLKYLDPQRCEKVLQELIDLREKYVREQLNKLVILKES